MVLEGERNPTWTENNSFRRKEEPATYGVPLFLIYLSIFYEFEA